jgi:hypothetical protein
MVALFLFPEIVLIHNRYSIFLLFLQEHSLFARIVTLVLPEDRTFEALPNVRACEERKCISNP